MSTLGERKQEALQQKIKALQAEFDQWRANTQAKGEFEKHQTQVIALTGHLEGLWEQTQEFFAEARRSGTVLDESRNIESLLLGLRRIWEFFRAKLVQRRDPQMQPFLRAADELSWACYEPVLARHPGARRQPPLVFLNGGLSPYALARDQAFPAEAVPGETLGGATYDPILQSLPIPMIGVPWNQVAHLPDLPVVAHETGHAVEHDFGLLPRVAKNLEARLGAASPRLAHWQAWSREVFADLWGCLMLGPAYTSALADFLAAGKADIDNEIAGETARYPTAHLRMLLCLEANETQGFAEQALAMRAQWLAQYDPVTMPGFAGDVPAVVEAVLGRTLDGSKFDAPLREAKGLGLTPAVWKWSQSAADELAARKAPKSATTIVAWAVAARAAYDASPARYVADGHAQKLLARSQELIQPGTRAREAPADEAALQALLVQSKADAARVFGDFARWSGARRTKPAAH